MAIQLGQFDASINRNISIGDIAAMTVIDTHFYVEDDIPLKDYLALWDLLIEWNDEGKEFYNFADFLACVRQQEGFKNITLCNAHIFSPTLYPIFSPTLYPPNFIEFLFDSFENINYSMTQCLGLCEAQ